MRVIVTGSRNLSLPHRPLVALILEGCLAQSLSLFEDLVIVEGGNPSGADLFAREFLSGKRSETSAGFYAGHDNVKHETIRAKWKQHGECFCAPTALWCPAAGPRRNQEMVDSGADLGIAFFLHGARNKGTSDCRDRMRKAGMLAMEIWVDAE